MKQHITGTQVSELSQKAKDKLYEWMVDKGYWSKNIAPSSMLLSIGQMIEFLGDNWSNWIFGGGDISDDDSENDNNDLCDDLWAEMREKLDNG